MTITLHGTHVDKKKNLTSEAKVRTLRTFVVYACFVLLDYCDVHKKSKKTKAKTLLFGTTDFQPSRVATIVRRNNQTERKKVNHVATKIFDP